MNNKPKNIGCKYLVTDILIGANIAFGIVIVLSIVAALIP